MQTAEHILDINRRVEAARASGNLAEAQDLCDAHDVHPDLFWTVMAEVSDLEASVVPLADDIPCGIDERFDRSDLVYASL